MSERAMAAGDVRREERRDQNGIKRRLEWKKMDVAFYSWLLPRRARSLSRLARAARASAASRLTPIERANGKKRRAKNIIIIVV